MSDLATVEPIHLCSVPADQLPALAGRGFVVDTGRIEYGRRITGSLLAAKRRGDEIVARSAMVLVDRMLTTSVRSAGEAATDPGWARWATFAKLGPVLHGEAHLVVRARGHHQCLVVWAEDVRFARDAPLLGVPLDLSLALMSELALRRLSRAIESR